uniref:SFRICE_018897 n=1 Tax=Spodoptera frugiperda TaxID=7108 RepID=A0A2H1V065_SPOFR
MADALRKMSEIGPVDTSEFLTQTIMLKLATFGPLRACIRADGSPDGNKSSPPMNNRNPRGVILGVNTRFV